MIGQPAEGEDTAQAATAAARRFVFVDALRGIAALWVVLFHLFASSHLEQLEAALPVPIARVLHAGYLGVTIFFVLSGFVIAHSVARRRVDATFAGWFVVRRSVRLTVPYWVSIALLSAYLYHAGEEVPDRGSLVAHALYLQDLLRMRPISPLYWSLCLEMQLYLVFIVLLATAYRFRSRNGEHRSVLVMFTVLALVAAAWPLGFVEAPNPNGFFLWVWYAFLLGVFAYWALAGTIPRLAFYGYSAVLFGYAIPSDNADAVVAVLTGAVLLEAGRAGGLHEWLSWRPLQFLGTISYSLYLMQQPISGATLDQLYARTPRTASYEVLWLASLLATICVGAWLFWRLVERPCTALSRYCTPRRQ